MLTKLYPYVNIQISFYNKKQKNKIKCTLINKISNWPYSFDGNSVTTHGNLLWFAFVDHALLWRYRRSAKWRVARTEWY